MTNDFLTLAATKGYYIPETLTPEIINNEWFSERYNWYLKQYNSFKLPETLKYENSGLFMKIDFSEKELISMDHLQILIFDGVNIRMINCYKNKYYLHPLHSDLWEVRKNLDNRTRPQLQEPNRIGVFTLKKLQDWFIYCDTYVEEYQKLSLDTLNKKSENLKIMNDFIDSLKLVYPDAKEYTWNNGDNKSIETHLFEVSFNLQDKGTYLQQRIKFKGSLNDILNIHQK